MSGTIEPHGCRIPVIHKCDATVTGSQYHHWAAIGAHGTLTFDAVRLPDSKLDLLTGRRDADGSEWIGADLTFHSVLATPDSETFDRCDHLAGGRVPCHGIHNSTVSAMTLMQTLIGTFRPFERDVALRRTMNKLYEQYVERIMMQLNEYYCVMCGTRTGLLPLGGFEYGMMMYICKPCFRARDLDIS